VLVVTNSRAGRPASAGPRYPSGRLKPQGDPRANNIWARIKEHGVRLMLDPRLGTELSRLSLDGSLTNTQVEAGFLVARIYGAFEKYTRKRRSAASPSYLRSFGDPDGPDDPVDPIELDELERRVRSAKRRWAQLNHPETGVLAGFFRDMGIGGFDQNRARNALETLCVEDRRLEHSDDLYTVSLILNRVAAAFGLTSTTAAAPVSTVAITARRPPRRRLRGGEQRRPDNRPPTKRADPRKDAWLQVQAKLNPKLSAEGLDEAWGIYEALVDRRHFRRDKERQKARRA
jgi:hypothetical protein